MISQLDGALLRFIFIPVSQVAGARYGATAGSLSRGCIPPMVLGQVVSSVFFGFEAKDQSIGHIMGAGGIFFTLLLAVLFWWQSTQADQHPNPFCHEPAFVRVYWLAALMIFDLPYREHDTGAELYRRVALRLRLRCLRVFSRGS